MRSERHGHGLRHLTSGETGEAWCGERCADAVASGGLNASSAVYVQYAGNFHAPCLCPGTMQREKSTPSAGVCGVQGEGGGRKETDGAVVPRGGEAQTGNGVDQSTEASTSGRVQLW